jgi:hypothetical protein
MVTREEVVAAINNLPEHCLEDLYQLIKEFEAGQEHGDLAGKNALARLRHIRISAAPDFSTTINLYPPGQKDA